MSKMFEIKHDYLIKGVWDKFELLSKNWLFFWEFSGLVQGFWDYFQDMTSEVIETQYEHTRWDPWDKFEVLPKSWLFVYNFQGFFRISVILFRMWNQKGLIFSMNTQYEVPKINLRSFLKNCSFLKMSRVYKNFP